MNTVRSSRSRRPWRRRSTFGTASARGRKVIAAGLLAVLVSTLIGQVPAQAQQVVEAKRLEAQRYESVPVQAVKATKPGPEPEEAAAKVRRPAPVWPAAGIAEVALPEATTARTTGDAAAVRAGALPVTVRPLTTAASARAGTTTPSKVRVEVLAKAKAEAAGVRGGLLLRVGRTDGETSAGQVEVGVDYAGFASAYGADWSSRLRLVQVPECALTTPRLAACVVEPLRSRNDVRTGRVSAAVAAVPVRAPGSAADAQPTGMTDAAAAAGTLIALAAGPSGGAGSFAASDLSPTSQWSHGGSTGGFQWSYPMQAPPGPGGPSPSIGLSYSSQSVDGRHAATNNQPGAIGEGFDYSPGFVERRYKACSDDMGSGANNTVETGDLCWGPDNAVLSLGGSTVELLKDGNGKWHPRKEDGSKVELLTSPTFSNGDNDNEYWKVTTADGTQYWFGRHQLPGWSADRPTTNSVLTVPVFGNNTGEPCHASTFAASDCAGKKQAWRWNLDYVQDVHGNTMSLWWTKETNHYAKNKVSTAPVAYDRASYLTRIDYGTDNRDGTEYAASSPYVQNAPGRVDFTNIDRCLANCTTKNATTWPDTPWDQECTATTTSCLNGAPTFWSAKRLTVVTTTAWKATKSDYQPAESWTLRQSFPDPGDGTRAGLWLNGITHRGLNGTTVTAPEVTFSGMQMQNRVDAAGSDWALAMNWWRVNSIRTEAGGEIYVTYTGRQCAKGGTMPAALDNNSLRCYPVKWAPPSYTDPITDYFHKYVVTEVQQIDHSGGSRPVRTAYEYPNPNNLPLWHHDDDDGLSLDDQKTWSQWRGYPTVVTYLGEGADRIKTETLYFRGMHGDKLASGGTRTSTVQGREGGAANDYDEYAGTPREQISWLGSTIVSASVNEMWRSDPPSATRAGTPVAEARFSRVKAVQSRTTTDSGVRRSTTTTTFDSYGMPTSVEDGGDDAKAGDEGCVKTEYARNTTVWLLTPVMRTHGYVGTCASSPATSQQITADTRFRFDSLAYGAVPQKGLVTATEAIKSFTGGTRDYLQTSTITHDVSGRAIESTDAAGEKTTTEYTPSSGGPVTKVVTTNPLLWTTTVELDPAFGQAVKTTDSNSRVTEIGYDALGRTTAVWEPGRLRETYPSDPSTSYSYNLSKTSVSSVTTRSINAIGAYDTTYLLLDALGRPRQTQASAHGGGRILTDTFFDAAGRAYKSNNAYYNASNPGVTLYSGLDQDVPSQTRTLFDATGRPIHSLLLGSEASVQVELARTSTTYFGDHVTVEPPVGDAATTVWTDIQGRTEKIRQYHGRTATGTYDDTNYTYHPTGQIATVKDASGNKWSYEYDLQGRSVSVSDPDSGVSTMAYNSVGDLEKTTDSRSETPDLYNTYDRLGRLLTVREGSLTGAKRIENTYDLPLKGLTKSTSRWIGSDEYRDEVVTVDAQYRPTQTKVTLPATQAGFCGVTATTCTFTSKATYRADGSPNTLTMPAAGGLDEEVLTYKYDSTDALPNQLATNYGDVSYYAIQSGYTNLNELSTLTRSTELTGAKFVQSTNRYEDATGQVKSSAILRSTSPSYIANTFYEYDATGNVLKIDDNSGSRPRDTQCFTYDHQRRLTKAWTPASTDCGVGPTETGLGGPAPYWHEWDFGSPDDPRGRVGNRLTQTERATATGTVTTSYSYPNAGAARPHSLSGWSRTDNTGTTTGSYTYDAAGNTVSRPAPSGGDQTLTWDVEGRLSTLTDSAGGNSYIYDGGGNRLIAKDNASSTLFLGSTEIRRNTSTGSISATRYYSFNGEVIGQRTATGITWLASDHQGTAQVSVGTDTNQTIVQRRQTPYGSTRGAGVTWPNRQGFLGGYQDATGLTHLGAREYDPKVGRFISVDPVNDPGNPQQLPAYTYAANNPTTFSDPSGRIIAEYAGVDTPTGLCPHGYAGSACQEYVEGKDGDTTAPVHKTTRRDPGRFNNKTLHETATVFFWIPGVDIADAALYVREGDMDNAMETLMPGPPGCKILKSACKMAGEWLGRLGKEARGLRKFQNFSVKINPAKDAQEMAAIKSAIRDKVGDAPKPKVTRAPDKKTGGGSGGDQPDGEVGASLRDINPTGGKKNCVRCAIQTDKMLAGDSWSPAPSGGAFPTTEITAYSGRPFHRRSVDDIVKTMTAFGDGSRGIIVGGRGPGKIGHAFNVVNQRGVVRFLDGQSGTAANLNDGFVEFWITFTQKGKQGE
ncbi:RHS repeat-associated core domain-containing protein [Micromonospora chokoriensis]